MLFSENRKFFTFIFTYRKSFSSDGWQLDILSSNSKEQITRYGGKLQSVSNVLTPTLMVSHSAKKKPVASLEMVTPGAEYRCHSRGLNFYRGDIGKQRWKIVSSGSVRVSHPEGILVVTPRAIPNWYKHTFPTALEEQSVTDFHYIGLVYASHFFTTIGTCKVECKPGNSLWTFSCHNFQHFHHTGNILMLEICVFPCKKFLNDTFTKGLGNGVRQSGG